MFDFPFTLDSLDSVPDQYKALYVEDDGEYKLDQSLSAKITKLVDSLDKERKRSKDANKDNKAWLELGESPEAVKQRIADLESSKEKEVTDLQKLIDEKGDARSSFEKIKNDLVKSHAAELEARDKSVAEMEATLREHMLVSEATRHIAAAKGKVKPLLPYVLQQLTFGKLDGKYSVRVIDSDGDDRLNKDGKPMDISALVEELKADNDFSALFEGSGATGSSARSNGSQGGGNVATNPFAKDSLNLTEQMRLSRENPTLADKMRRQAS